MELNNIIRTQRTYKTVANAEKALKTACEKIGLQDAKNIRYLIAVAPDGRFVPVVQTQYDPAKISLVHEGITIM